MPDNRHVLFRKVPYFLFLFLILFLCISCGGSSGDSSSNNPQDETEEENIPLLSISGLITDPKEEFSSDKIHEITVKLEGKDEQVSKDTTCETNGNFEFSGIYPGTYVITPFLEEGSFIPGNREITLSVENSQENNFEIHYKEDVHTVSGEITGEAIEGITIILKKQDNTKNYEDRTNGDGEFEFNVLNGEYTLIPQKIGYEFDPPSIPISVNDSDISVREFKAVKLIGDIKWQVGTNGVIYSSPVLGKDGVIYIGSWDHNLYAIRDEGTKGDVIWTFGTGNAVFSSPVLDKQKEVIYFGSLDKLVYAIDLEGEGKWQTDLGDWVFSSAAIGSDGTIYIGCNNKKLYALNHTNGQIKWEQNLGNMVSVPVLSDDGTIYVGATDMSNYEGKFYALDSSDGSIKWTFDTPVISRPAIGKDGTIYVGSLDSKVYALDPVTHNSKWSFQTEAQVWSSPIVGEDESIYIGSDDTYFYALTKNGSLKWKCKTGAEVRSSAAFGPSGIIYIGSHDNDLRAIDPFTGEILWKISTEGPITCVPIVSEDEVIYFGSQDKSIYALFLKRAE